MRRGAWDHGINQPASLPPTATKRGKRSSCAENRRLKKEAVVRGEKGGTNGVHLSSLTTASSFSLQVSVQEDRFSRFAAAGGQEGGRSHDPIPHVSHTALLCSRRQILPKTQRSVDPGHIANISSSERKNLPVSFSPAFNEQMGFRT